MLTIISLITIQDYKSSILQIFQGTKMTKIMPTNEQNFLQLLNTIESHFPLSYSKEINELFADFTEGLDSLISYDETLSKRLNTIWAERGFSVEKHFSKEKNIQSFDFYPKYKRLLRFDSLMIRKMMKRRAYEKVIFVGSGPLPLSLKLLHINVQKVGYDIVPQALELSRKSVPKDRFGRKIIYKEADFFNIKISEKRPIIIYIAGLIKNKKEGISRLVKQLPTGSLIIVRTVANDKRELLYERLRKNDFLKYGKVKEFNPIKNSGIVNGMIVIRTF